MNKLSAQTQMIIAGALIVLIAVVAIFFGILPEFDKAAQATARIEELKAETSTAQSLVARRQGAKAQAAETEVELIRVANQVPEAPELPSIIINLQDTANQCGLVFAQITPQAPTAVVGLDGQPAGYSVIPIDVKVEGQWADMIEYVSKLSKYTRGIRVKTALFAGIDGTTEKARYVEGKITLEVYTMSVINVSTTAPAVPSAPATPPADAQPSQ